MGGWNKPSAANQPMKKGGYPPAKQPEGAARRGAKAPSSLKGIVAGVVVVVLGVVVMLCLSPDDGAKEAAQPVKPSRIKDVATTSEQTDEEVAARAKLKKIQAELGEKIKDYVTRAPTSDVSWIVKPLDPNDPDNALRTSVAKDVATLLAIPPGLPIPKCIPFGFMFEEVGAMMARADGIEVVNSDGGNKKFLQDLDKWKVTIKETDSEERIKVKQNLVESQLEILKGLDEGISVNDSIRAAYEYRVKAAEKRSGLISVLKETHDADPDLEVTKGLIKRVNEDLEKEGLVKISTSDVVDGYDDELDNEDGGENED